MIQNVMPRTPAAAALDLAPPRSIGQSHLLCLQVDMLALAASALSARSAWQMHLGQ